MSLLLGVSYCLEFERTCGLNWIRPDASNVVNVGSTPTRCIAGSIVQRLVHWFHKPERMVRFHLELLMRKDFYRQPFLLFYEWLIFIWCVAHDYRLDISWWEWFPSIQVAVAKCIEVVCWKLSNLIEPLAAYETGGELTWRYDEKAA